MKIKEIRTCKICPNTFKVRTTSNRLNCCTRCSWAYKRSPEIKAKQKVYHQSPKFKAKRKAYLQLPEVKAKKKTYEQSPKYKARRKAYQHIKNQMKINKQYPCKICNEIFEFNYLLKQHMDEHRI